MSSPRVGPLRSHPVEGNARLLTEDVCDSWDDADVDPDYYRSASSLTELDDEQRALVDAVRADPVQLCAAAQGLLVLPELATGLELSPRRLEERNTRPARRILQAALSRDGGALDVPRPLKARVTGTCRHFAVLSCAFLRARAIPARVRCGFETYFQPGRNNDHWITEHWDGARWVRIDSEILGFDLLDRPEDLADGQFLTGAEAWAAYRAGADPMSFGVHSTENWGAAEIVGNAIRDLAAVNKVEMLPWDEWGPMALLRTWSHATHRGADGQAHGRARRRRGRRDHGALRDAACPRRDDLLTTGDLCVDRETSSGSMSTLSP